MSVRVCVAEARAVRVTAGTPAAQTVLPDEDYNCLSQVEVAAIPYAVSDNTSGGKTVTIG